MRILPVLFLFFFVHEVSAQILPGMDKEEIHRYMNTHWGGYNYTEPSNADELDFIKFEHVSGDKTLIVFMTEEGICRFTRLFIDIDYLEDVIELFDSDYKTLGEKLWTARERGREFSISIDESDWMFTVTVKPVTYSQE